jgi:hypothetical protein
MVTRYVSDSGHGPTTSITVAIEVAGDKMRMEISSAMFPAAAGIYMLIDGAAGTITNVMPTQQMAMTMDVEGVTGIVRFSIKGEPTVDVEDLGPGENILGLPTRRYHHRTVYTLVTTLGDKSCEKTVVTDGDQWMTPSTKLSESAMKTLLDVNGGQMTPPAMRVLAEKARVKMPGVLLRAILTSTTTTPAGEASSVKVQSDVTSFGSMEIDPARLAPPAGFNMMDTREMVKEMDPSMIAGALSDATRRAMCGGKPTN